MFRELEQLAQTPDGRQFDVFQAPRHLRERVDGPLPRSFTDILLGHGYADSDDLGRLVGEWRSLFDQWKADLVIADFAPTALLAAKTLGLRRVAYGNGFTIPPRLDPLPAFRFDEPIDAARLRDADRLALANVNAAVERYGCPPLTRLADIFETDEDFLCTFPQLDHYGVRALSGYWGPRVRFDVGSTMKWPEGAGKRIFIYLKSSFALLDPLVDYLASRSHHVIAFIPGVDDQRRQRLSSRHRLVTNRPARLDLLLKRCDLLVSQGGEIAAGALTQGVPQLCFPIQYEQYITSRRLEQMGCGLWLPPSASGAEMEHAFDRILSMPNFSLAARQFSKDHAGFTPSEHRRRIAARLQEILAKPAGPMATPSREFLP